MNQTEFDQKVGLLGPKSTQKSKSFGYKIIENMIYLEIHTAQRDNDKYHYFLYKSTGSTPPPITCSLNFRSNTILCCACLLSVLINKKQS